MNSNFNLEAEIDELLALEKKAELSLKSANSFLHNFFDSQVDPLLTELTLKLESLTKHLKNQKSIQYVHQVQNVLGMCGSNLPLLLDEEVSGNVRQARRRKS